MAKRVRGEDGKLYKVKTFYKKVWFWILVVILVAAVGGSLGVILKIKTLLRKHLPAQKKQLRHQIKHQKKLHQKAKLQKKRAKALMNNIKLF